MTGIGPVHREMLGYKWREPWSRHTPEGAKRSGVRHKKEREKEGRYPQLAQADSFSRGIETPQANNTQIGGT